MSMFNLKKGDIVEFSGEYFSDSGAFTWITEPLSGIVVEIKEYAYSHPRTPPAGPVAIVLSDNRLVSLPLNVKSTIITVKQRNNEEES
tara:strand:- start:482 stop:745 length:264 start_codon:yes stop_codon:yes gene_type:complete